MCMRVLCFLEVIMRKLLSYLFNDIYGYVSWQRMKKRQEV